MSKTSAPLLSFGASGQIGKSMVMSKWRGVQYARRYVIPANPRTTAQQANRALFAFLREMWKLCPPIARAPWDAFASGRPFLGLNKFVGENVRVIGVQTDMDDFIGSPGARGGVAPDSVVASTGSSAGEIDVTFTLPTPPTGWTLANIQAMAFPEQDAHGILSGPIVADEVGTPFGPITLTGLGSGVACQVAGWLEWTKPDGSLAYSVGITDQATSGS